VADGLDGAPYIASPDQPVDDWSAGVFLALRSWPPAAGGLWTWREPGYLVLEIDHYLFRPIEPATLSTEHGDIAVSFGQWRTNLALSDEPVVEEVVQAATDLLDGWLAGETRTAVFFRANGSVRGSFPLGAQETYGELELGGLWLSHDPPVRVEIQAARREAWQAMQTPASWFEPPPAPEPPRGPVYCRTRWGHGMRSYPLEIWSELGDYRFEVRRIEFFEDGRVAWTGHGADSSLTPLPDLEEIADDPDCISAETVTAEEFEAAWARRLTASD
jgi:hypothetical protein